MGSAISKIRKMWATEPAHAAYKNLYQRLWDQYHVNPSSGGLYKPLDLDTREFRLLIIHPRAGPEDVIVCTLCTQFEAARCIDKQPATLAYDAFSYVWQTDGPGRLLQINGLTCNIPLNLWQMLYYQRGRPDRYFSFVWVDAICINQDDLVERGHQVALMGDIYAQADKVIAWLGAPTTVLPGDPTIEALEVVREISRHAIEGNSHFADIPLFREAWGVGPQDNLDITKPIKLDKISSLEMLLSNTLWGRTWCVQEIVLGDLKTEFCYANRIEHWTSVFGFLFWYVIHETCCLKPIEKGDSSLREAAAMLRAVSDALGSYLYTQSRRSRGTGDDILTTMATFRNRYCTRPHDKIYGYLGLCSSQPILPNYLLPVEQVYRDFGIAQIRLTGSLDVLLHVTRHRDLTGLPSWVPDWSRPIKNEVLSFRSLPFCGFEDFRIKACLPSQVGSGDLRDVDLLPGHPSRPFRAAGQSVANMKDLGAQGIGLSGCYFDVIEQVFQVVSMKEVSTKFQGGAWFVSIDLEGLRSWDQCTRRKSTQGGRYVGGGTMEEARVRTMFSDTKKCDDHQGRVRCSPDRTKSLIKAFKLLLEKGEQADLHMTDYVKANMYQSLFITKQGYLGQCDLDVAVGDTIAVLHGGKHPFVLRKTNPSDRHYVLMGPTYVHGIMDGELMLNGPRTRSFVLR